MTRAFAISFAIITTSALSPFYCLQAEAKKPLNINDIKTLLRSNVSNAKIRTLIEEHGVNFIQTQEDIDGLKNIGAEGGLIEAIQRAFNNRNIETVVPETSSNTSRYLSNEVNNELSGIEHQFKTDKEEGSIYIETEPASAEIHINGKYKAISPAEISVPAGRYTIVFIKQNYRPYPLSLNIRKGINLPVMVKLSPR